ncbi:MAG: YkgJ family cysteine cluster protein [Candidatus Hodarchaeota archaeon]
MKKLKFSCTRCGNCCTDKKTIVNVTYLDILRIKNGLNLELNEVLEILGFYIFDKKLTDNGRKKMIISPIMTEKGLAFAGLLKNSLGGCYFYDSTNKKCLIYNLRPAFCRTFPFSFRLLDENEDENKREIDIFYTEKAKQYCPGISDESPFINQDHWIRLSRKILEDIKNNDKIIQDWNEKVKNCEIKPTVKNFLREIFSLNNL